MSRTKWNIETVREIFNKEGYILLSEVYINNKQKLDYICPKGHKHSICLDKFLSGRRCPYCSNEKIAEEKRNSFKKVEKIFNDGGYVLLSKTYKNSGQVLETMCPNGHIHKTTLANFQKGQRCGKCYGKNIKYTYEQVKEIFSKEGCELLSTSYENCKQKLKYKCPNGHNHEITLDKFINKKDRCPYCNIVYKGEEAIRIFLEKNQIEYKAQYFFNDCRDTLALRFDFFIPSLNLCIEYDGIGHFKPINYNGIDDEKAIKGFEKGKLHDKIKDDYCKENNINLLRIPYWEINNIETILTQTLNL